jgi:transcriptional regulator with XRE-family HTH domain
MPAPDRQPDDHQTATPEGGAAETERPDSELPGAEHSEFLDVGAFIRNQRERAKLSVRRLAELADVSNPYLSQIERGLRRPSAEVLQQVAHALRISVESLYVRAGILSNESRPVSTVPEAIDADPILTAEQKLALRNVYDSFVASR